MEKQVSLNSNYKFNKIDSEFKSYIIGYIAGNSNIKYSVTQIKGNEDLMKEIGGELQTIVEGVSITNKRGKISKINVINKKILDILKFIGDEEVNKRNLPIVPKKLNKYMILGFFDSVGNVSWGYRKDRKKMWYRITFISSLSLLITLQNILIKELDISSIIRPKKNSENFILEFNNEKNIMKFYNWIYNNKYYIRLSDKFNDYNALRLELEEFGGNIKY